MVRFITALVATFLSGACIALAFANPTDFCGILNPTDVIVVIGAVVYTVLAGLAITLFIREEKLWDRPF